MNTSADSNILLLKQLKVVCKQISIFENDTDKAFQFEQTKKTFSRKFLLIMTEFTSVFRKEYKRKTSISERLGWWLKKTGRKYGYTIIL